ncbi:DUF86 domain-containing protein [bacterium]|nr:DUF86 domain-containing protein [bacterium]
MSKREVRLLLEDILEAINKIQDYTSAMSEDDFRSDSKTIDAVVRNLEIIGEAANNISKSYRDQHSNVEWNQIIGMRHRIIHEYFGVDENIIWFVVQNDLLRLQSDISRLLSDDQK